MTIIAGTVCYKCNGRLNWDKDKDGEYLHCYRCGKYLDLQPAEDLTDDEIPDVSYIVSDQVDGIRGASGFKHSEVYRDGCEVAESCFHCPLEQCKHDDMQGWLRYKKKQSDLEFVEQVEKLVDTGIDPTEARRQVAHSYGLTERTGYRILSRLGKPASQSETERRKNKIERLKELFPEHIAQIEAYRAKLGYTRQELSVLLGYSPEALNQRCQYGYFSEEIWQAFLDFAMPDMGKELEVHSLSCSA